MQLAGVRPVVNQSEPQATDISARQVEIVQHLLAGETNEEIGNALYVAKRTVENHLYRLYKTLGLDGGREELVERLGWLVGIE
jgi:DNA-binding NarL/FixJ family response regulator